MANAFLLAPLPISGAPITVGDLQAGSGSYAFNDYAGLVCQMACNTGGSAPNEARILFDLGADRIFDTIMIFGLELLPLNAGFRVEYATADQGYFTGARTTDTSASAYAGAVLPYSGKGVTLWQSAASATARYFALSFTTGSAGNAVRFARIVVGKRYQPGIGFEYGAQLGVRDLGNMDVSARGVLLRHRGRKLRTVSLNFPSQTKPEAEGAAMTLLEYAGNTECLALCVNPVPDPMRQTRCHFGPLVGDLSNTWRTAAAWEWRVNLLGVI